MAAHLLIVIDVCVYIVSDLMAVCLLIDIIMSVERMMEIFASVVGG